MTLSLRHTFSAADAIIADEVMDNFNDVVEALGNITNSMIASGAGITSDKLADRYIVEQPSIPLIPFGSDADYSDARDNSNDFLVPTTSTVIGRYKVMLASGQDAYLCGCHLYVNFMDPAGGTNYPKFSIYVNSVQVGGDWITIDNYGDPNGFYMLGKTNPIANPLLALANGDTIEFRMTATGSTPGASGVIASPVIKKELVS